MKTILVIFFLTSNSLIEPEGWLGLTWKKQIAASLLAHGSSSPVIVTHRGNFKSDSSRLSYCIYTHRTWKVLSLHSPPGWASPMEISPTPTTVYLAYATPAVKLLPLREPKLSTPFPSRYGTPFISPFISATTSSPFTWSSVRYLVQPRCSIECLRETQLPSTRSLAGLANPGTLRKLGVCFRIWGSLGFRRVS